ncbi:tetratricopeptide repeat protein [Ornithinimicrobium panacihumi]|uniref:tetratricopeptide repeat protein n=1 Tax=Ornithinimicrobium panacihumi TaxID=2008449 RepID=UPI003F8B8202
MDDYFDLGTYSRPVTTTSAEAQRWFDRGLVWTYGFNHEEGARCFEKAAQADPGCAMAHWGIAYALGPNYNKPWEFFDEEDLRTTVQRTHDAIERAEELAPHASPVEQALIGALRHRYTVDAEGADFSIWNEGYAAAMGEVYDAHPEDLDVATLYADALMMLTPWELWDLGTGEPAPGSRAREATEILDRVMATTEGREHPGALHFYIHLWEMSATPERALTVADRLRNLVPDAGHLQHMPTHLDVLCGDYRQVIATNQAAVLGDRRFVEARGPLNFYTLYRAHNLHFIVYGAMFSGQSQIAMEAVEELERSIPEELLRVESPPMADWLEGFLSVRVHALIRFGRWEEILEIPEPGDPELYATTVAMRHYGRGVALSALERVGEAEAERELFRTAYQAVPESRTIFNNTCRDILGVASAMLDGELEYRRGEHDTAYASLRRAIELDDTLPYDEPWGWMQPTRHAYGALLLEQGHVEEALAVYRADLGLDDTLPRTLQHPGNVWALHGFHECLTTLGRDEEARLVEGQLRLARAVADVPVVASCLCRLSAVHAAKDAATVSEARPAGCCSDEPARD